MVVRAAWLPSRGTINVGESNEPFNPTLGQLSFSASSPAHSAAEADKMPPSSPTSESAPPKPVHESTTSDALLEKGGDELSTLLDIASMCSTAKVFKKEGEGWTARGDPTECAIQTFAHRFGWGRERWIEGDSPEWSESRVAGAAVS